MTQDGSCPRCNEAHGAPGVAVGTICPSCAVISAVTAEFPEQVGHLVLGPEIARGGMGAVLLAHDQRLGRELAVKVLLADHLGNPELVLRFMEEARIAGQLQHPGVAPVHEMGMLPDHRPYFSMKLVSGQTLAKLLRQRAEPSEDLHRFLGIFEQVAQTVAFAHASGVIHRDLKPANVMVGRFGEVQVMDWGLAKIIKRPAQAGIAGVGETAEGVKAEAGQQPTTPRPVESGDASRATTRADLGRAPLNSSFLSRDWDLSRHGVVMGTPGYMPPEQASGECGSVDERADVYALGAILCEILVGRPPVPRQAFLKPCPKAQDQDSSESPDPFDFCSADPDLIKLSRRCLETDKALRPSNAGLVIEDLNVYLTGVRERLRASELDRARAEARADEERKRRRISLALAGSILLFLVLLSTGLSWWQSRESARRERAASAVEEAIDEVTILMARASQAPTLDALKLLEQAQTEAKLAVDLAQRTDVDADQARRAAQIQQEAARRRASAIRTQEIVQAERNLRQTLEEIRLSQSGDGLGFRPGSVPARYLQAFQDADIDLFASRTIESIKNSNLREEIIVALDNWTSLLGVEDPMRQRLIDLVDAVDGSQWRRNLRTALMHHDIERLAEFATRPESAHQPPAMVVWLATVLSKAGRLAEAESLLTTSQTRSPGDFWINLETGRVLLSRRSPDALGYLRAAIAARPRSPGARWKLALALRDLGELSAAEATFAELEILEPNLFWVLINRGDVLHTLRRHGEAETVFRRAIALKPGHSWGHSGLSNALLHQGRIAEAHEASDRAYQVGSNDWRTVLHHVHMLNKVGKFTECINLINKCNINSNKLLNNEKYELLCDKAVALLGLGRDEEAVESSLDALRIEHRGAQAYFQMGIALRNLGEFEAAEFSLSESIRCDPQASIAPLELSRMLLLTNQPAQAEKVCRAAFAWHPNDSGLLESLDQARWAQGKTGQFIQANSTESSLDSALLRP